MLDLLAAQREGVIVSARNINKLIRRYLPQGIHGEIKEYIDNGVLIPPHKSALGPCARLRTVDVRLFDLGFNYQASLSRGLITGLREGSNAHRAGLRNGDRIMARTIFHGDTTKAVEIKVKAADGEKQMRFLPLGDKIRVPQYMWDVQRFTENREDSLSWFGLRR
jgi:predicted metalloprotease with PDZ domain